MYDQDIRDALKQFLMKRSPAPSKILDELKVNNGGARADVVALYKYAHCFEIKSDRDSMSRVENQVLHYDLTFRKVTVVTTPKSLTSLLKRVPDYWGVLVAKGSIDSPKFTYHRRAQLNPNFNGEVALLSLWKNELIDLDSILGSTGLPKVCRREQIATKISGEASNNDIAIAISKTLRNRMAS